VLLIPSIDLKDGRCVRLYQGDFAQATAYASTPHALLSRYQALGACWVHIVDLDGAKDGKPANHSVVASLSASTAVKLQVGGGIRTAAAVEVLLDVGASRVVIGSVAVHDPQEVLQWFQRFGSEHLCLALDVRTASEDHPRVHTHGWTRAGNITLWEALAPYRDVARHILCTDIDRDGTLSGPNLELYAQSLARFPQLAWQASGGIRGSQDLKALAEIGVTGAVSGKALLENRIPDEELRPFLPDASFPASMSATALS
jgi:phosphoribosylformimino-5-aminoimidazole carboxamide ribotide isomerase